MKRGFASGVSVLSGGDRAWHQGGVTRPTPSAVLRFVADLVLTLEVVAILLVWG